MPCLSLHSILTMPSSVLKPIYIFYSEQSKTGLTHLSGNTENLKEVVSSPSLGAFQKQVGKQEPLVPLLEKAFSHRLSLCLSPLRSVRVRTGPPHQRGSKEHQSALRCQLLPPPPSQIGAEVGGGQEHGCSFRKTVILIKRQTNELSADCLRAKLLKSHQD